MKFILFFLPLAVLTLSGCAVQHSMERNRAAIDRSSDAIERNSIALDKVTEKLIKMQKE